MTDMERTSLAYAGRSHAVATAAARPAHGEGAP